MTVIVVEGESDRIALEVLGARLGVQLPRVVSVGGSGGARRGARELAGDDLVGLVDANERAQFEREIERVFVCEPDLEGELIRALGADGVMAVIEAEGELESFRMLQKQPAQRDRPIEAQLSRFFGGRSGNKHRYARLLAGAVPLERIPPPLAAVIRTAVASRPDGPRST